MSGVFAWVAALLLVLPAPCFGQARDRRAPTTGGTARVTGIVVSADRDARPLRRARVSISGIELDYNRATITNDDGSFVFEGLPPGSFSLLAAKDGYAPARPPSLGAAAVDVRAGETGHATLRLPKGAVITGRILGPTGEPAAGVTVTTVTRRFNPAAGQRQATLSTATNVTTDDRGIYRIFGLAAGSYVVTAVPRVPPGGDVRAITEAEVKRALSELKQQTFATRPGMPVPAPVVRAAEPAVSSLTLVPVYYPGTPLQQQAVPVTVQASEVRDGIDFDLDYVRSATVEGFMTAPPGLRVQLLLEPAQPAGAINPAARTASVRGDGGFSFRNVPPGHWAIVARALPAAGISGRGPIEALPWGRTEVMVTGEDITGLSVVLRDPLTISGRVVFASASGVATPSFEAMRVPLPPTVATGILAPPLPGVLIERDRFTLAGVVPGPFRFRNPPPGLRAPLGGWWLASFTVNGKELLDTELNFSDNVDDAVITFSDRASELSGTVRDPDEKLVREGRVVIFSTNEQSWFFHSRRVAAVQVREGRFVVRNLPAGEYFITVADGLEINEWFDREVLAELAAGAQRVKLGAFEQKTFDLRVTR